MADPAILVSGSPGAFTVEPVEVPELAGHHETCATHGEAMATARVWADEMRRVHAWPVPVVDQSEGGAKLARPPRGLCPE